MKVTPTDVFKIAKTYVTDSQEVLGPFYPKILGWIRSRNFKELAGCSAMIDWDAKYNPRLVASLLQVEAFFKKNASLPPVCDTLGAAGVSFQRAEKLCRITNRRLDHYYVERGRLDPDLNLWMTRMESFIATCLGDFASFLPDLPNRIRFTDGATATTSRRNSRPYMKVGRPLETPLSSIPYWDALLRHWGSFEKCSLNTELALAVDGSEPTRHPWRWKVLDENVVTVVPKNWKTDRTIAKEPSGALPLQLAFDAWAKDRLRRYGVDLSDQSKNQRLAKLGSETGKLATLDLSMASDTLSFNLVAWLLPEPWLRYLLACRSARYTGPFGTGTYAKFSSMGNGATFSLESLIFYAAVRAVGSRGGTVYGDDIIVETELAGDLQRLLRFIGFYVNREKSFTSGPFRESCGVHYYDGTYVSPFTIKEWGPSRAVLHHNVNNLVAIAEPNGQLAEFLRELVQDNALRCVPYNEASTSGIWVDPTTAYTMKLIRVERGNKRTGCLTYAATVFKPKKRLVGDWRTCFVWHLTALERERRSLPSMESGTFQKSRLYGPKAYTALINERVCHIDRSRDASSRGTYSRARCGWFPPTAATPAHLFWWSDLMSA